MYQGKFSNRSGRPGTQQPSERPQMPVMNRPQPSEPVWQENWDANSQEFQQEAQSFQNPQRPAQPRQPQRPYDQQSWQGQRPEANQAFNQQPARRPQQPQNPRFQQNPRTQQNPNRQQDTRFQQDPRFQFDPQKAAPVQPYAEGFVQNGQQPPQPPKKRRRGPRISGIIFYLLLIVGVVFVYARTQKSLDQMNEQLISFEKAQSSAVSQKYFDELFANPNWGLIYDNAGTEISKYEGKDAFKKYMEAKVGTTPLTYRSISGYNEQEMQYGVFLDQEKVAEFSIVNQSTNASMPDWKFGELHVFFTTNETYRIQNQEGHIVKVNGVPLDDSFLIRKDGIKPTAHVGNLEQPLTGSNVCLHELTDFLAQPVVTIEDTAGNQMQVSYDEQSRTFSEPVGGEETSIPEEAKELGLNAVRTYCKYMIRKTSAAELSKYFKSDTDTYRAITSSDLTWIQREKAHGFANEKVSDYIRFNDNCFSIRVSLTWQLTRQDDSIKESPVDGNLVFEKDGGGTWRCTRMTGYDFTEPQSMVRVRFMQDGNVIESRMVETDAKTIQCPNISAPEGMVNKGWLVLMQDAEGNDYLQRVLEPDAEGNAAVPDGLFDEPVDLRPVYLKKE